MRRSLRRPLTVLAALALTAPFAASVAVAAPPGQRAPDLVWTTTVTDPDQSLRGLDAVDRVTAWVAGGSVSGGAGGVFRTTDGGATWQDVAPPNADLNFRDVEATSATTASVLSIGEGEASRVYRTTDGGASWTETFRSTEPSAFYNCMAFFPGGRHGLAVSDPVDGRFRIAATDDGGASWRVLPADGMPDSTGEYNFSASGECLTVRGNVAWFGSGGADARVFRSTDRGRTWTAADTGLPAGEAAGVDGIAFRTPRHGIVVGGDFAAPADGTDVVATTRDGGRTWTDAGDLTHLGEDVAWVPGTRAGVVVVGESGAVGGVSVSGDGGATWIRASSTGFHTLDCTRDGSCWAAGSGGRVARAAVR
ncbi:WD40/YVTN/BNR-like repeat-containing protein [Phycicoccus flavus]|uniref:WD40/YVTN/BNR-like repeat-containing protein n=1 Tax=Phycicoccus flavus TaxID=2502783 RepID=UPI000FEB93F3|nr:oxidoreductase [Phycicoccus flavus]NHA66628.1 oxidoreductase [Phycicoccus flavus]